MSEVLDPIEVTFKNGKDTIYLFRVSEGSGIVLAVENCQYNFRDYADIVAFRDILNLVISYVEKKNEKMLRKV